EVFVIHVFVFLSGGCSKLNSQLSGQLPPPPGSKKSHSRSLSGQYRGVVHDPPSVVTSQSGQFPTQTSLRDDSPHNSKSPPFSPTQSPPTSPANQKSLIKQHTAPALVFANSHPNLASAAVASHPSSMTSSLESAEATRHLVNPNSSMSVEGGHVNPVALSEVTVPPRVAATVNSGPVGGSSHHHHPQSGGAGVENGNWTMFDDEESHMLIGSGVKQHYNNLEPPNFDSSSISSEADSVDDIWSINDEQREYYVNQFKTMQPDLNAFITGKGPIDLLNFAHFLLQFELGIKHHIICVSWQLSDLNCDGALSLEEFCIAMHLVVLRRNDIELPDHLPVSLMPYSTLTSDEPFAADLPPGSTLKRATPPSPHSNVAQWTAFGQESPDSNGVPSPAHLVNFEFSKPSADPDLKIVQPVPVHMLPEALQNEGYDRGRAFSDSSVPHESCGTDHGDSSPPLYKQRAYTEIHHQDPGHLDSPNSKYSTPIQGRPRPVPPKKNSVNTGIKNLTDVDVMITLMCLCPWSGYCAVIVVLFCFINSSVPHESCGTDHGDSSPPLYKQRAYTEIHHQDPGHLDSPNSKYSTPIQGRPRPVPPKKNSVNTAPQLVAPAVPQLVAPAVPPRISPKEVSHCFCEEIQHTEFVFVFVVNVVLCKILIHRFSSYLIDCIVQSFSQKPSDPGVIGSMEHRAATKNLQNVIQTHRRSVSLGIKLGYPSVPPELPPVAHVVENNETSFDKEKAEERETTPDSSAKERLQSKPTLTLRQGSRDKRDIHMAVRTHKERNSMLTRLNSELNQELQEVMEQRIALEIQLEHLRPFSS
uniref:EF-hand domain-containing protein n=1 Tax=Biomphalaria glabrata TaxID=6526 RepID=A0A2C9KXP9_BIOGL